jgi:hypothetical protein
LLVRKNIKNTISNFFFVLSLVLSLSSCKDLGKVKFDNIHEDAATSGNTGLVFSGISSIDLKTDTTMRLNWTAHADAVAYDVFNVTSGVPVWLAIVSGQASSSTSLTGLTPNQLYKFRVRAKNIAGINDSNTNDVSAITNMVSPSGLALFDPATSPATDNTPTVRVSGVNSGDTVKLFTNNTCTNQVASGTTTGTTIDLTSSTLTIGTYNFYATTSNSIPNSSACSTATVSYTIIACPTDYVLVPFNTAVGTSADFCVAKYEMKCVGSSCPTSSPGVNAVATSQSSGSPWVNISQTNSSIACSNLNAINGVSNKYYLISNPEWMTIARNLENVDSNWSSGTAGSGVLAHGWTNSNSTIAPSTDSSCLYNTAADTCGATGTVDSKRTLTLTNGEIIWDLSGNVWEWVDWQVIPANKAYIAASPINTNQGWKEFKDLDTNIGGSDEMKPSTWQSTFLTAIGVNGIGRYSAGTNSVGGAAFRGGSWNSALSAGTFALNLLYASGDVNSSTGFRCVYRP